MITLTFSQLIIAAIFMIAAVIMAIVYRELYRKRSEQYIYYRRAFDTASKNNDLLESEIRRFRPVRGSDGKFVKLTEAQRFARSTQAAIKAIKAFERAESGIDKIIKEGK